MHDEFIQLALQWCSPELARDYRAAVAPAALDRLETYRSRLARVDAAPLPAGLPPDFCANVAGLSEAAARSMIARTRQAELLQWWNNPDREKREAERQQKEHQRSALRRKLTSKIESEFQGIEIQEQHFRECAAMLARAAIDDFLNKWGSGELSLTGIRIDPDGRIHPRAALDPELAKLYRRPVPGGCELRVRGTLRQNTRLLDIRAEDCHSDTASAATHGYCKDPNESLMSLVGRIIKENGPALDAQPGNAARARWITERIDPRPKVETVADYLKVLYR